MIDGQDVVSEPDSWVLSFTFASNFFGVSPVGVLPSPFGPTAVGLAFNLDFLFVGNEVWVYTAWGPSIGSSGSGLSVEIGPVFDIDVPSDYEGAFLAASLAYAGGGPLAHPALSFGRGIAATAFTSHPDILNGSWGYSFGAPIYGGSGLSSQASYGVSRTIFTFRVSLSLLDTSGILSVLPPLQTVSDQPSVSSYIAQNSGVLNDIGAAALSEYLIQPS